MDTRTPDNAQNACPPPDDGVIQRAIANLDSQLASWSATVVQAQASLQRAAECPTPPAAPTHGEEADSGHSGPDQAATLPDQDQTSQSVAGHDSSPSGAEGRSPRTAAAGTADRRDDRSHRPGQTTGAGPEVEADFAPPFISAPDDRQGSAAASIPRIRRTGPSRDSTGPPGQRVGAAETVESQDAEEDVQALLASVDEETGRRVRLLMRLGGGGKSVRELIKECQAADSDHSLIRPQRKSWWTRGR